MTSGAGVCFWTSSRTWRASAGVFSYRGGPLESSLTKDWLKRSKDAVIVIVCVIVWRYRGGMGQIYIVAL